MKKISELRQDTYLGQMGATAKVYSTVRSLAENNMTKPAFKMVIQCIAGC